MAWHGKSLWHQPGLIPRLTDPGMTMDVCFLEQQRLSIILDCHSESLFVL